MTTNILYDHLQQQMTLPATVSRLKGGDLRDTNTSTSLLLQLLQIWSRVLGPGRPAFFFHITSMVLEPLKIYSYLQGRKGKKTTNAFQKVPKSLDNWFSKTQNL